MSLNGEPGSDMYLPGAASLLDQLDKRILIILRDGRHLVGILRTFDQVTSICLFRNPLSIIYSFLIWYWKTHLKE